ncbi:MAG: hypothetical protein HKP18_04270, partial [Acidimicrobiia bacterium]|nr:hypothetical protein [Acidimicrobiia bacterium]
MRSHTTTPIAATTLVVAVVLVALGSVELGSAIGGWPGLVFGVTMDLAILAAVAWYMAPRLADLRGRGSDVRPWSVFGLRIAEGPRVFIYAAAAQLGAAVATRGLFNSDPRVIDPTWPQWILLMTAAVIAAPLWEELLFRGFLLDSYNKVVT